jgi:hypothetical protein
MRYANCGDFALCPTKPINMLIVIHVHWELSGATHPGFGASLLGFLVAFFRSGFRTYAVQKQRNQKLRLAFIHGCG